MTQGKYLKRFFFHKMILYLKHIKAFGVTMCDLQFNTDRLIKKVYFTDVCVKSAYQDPRDG